MDTKKELVNLYKEIRERKRSELYLQINKEKKAATKDLSDAIIALEQQVHAISVVADEKYKEMYKNFDNETLLNTIRLVKGEVDINEVI